MKGAQQIPRIMALWSAPRCRSTAFFRMMTERGDYIGVHEPFSYLAEFGCSTVDGHEVHTEPELIEAIRALSARRPVFFKDTTDERYPAVLADRGFIGDDARHTFIIRHPRRTIASYHEVNPDVRLGQIGFAALYELFDRVRDLTGQVPVVIDADDLVAQPERTVAAYCARVGLPFLPGALTWQQGTRPEWRPSERWHSAASASRGFQDQPRTYAVDVEHDPVLRGYLDFHLPYYEKLSTYRLAV